VSRDIGTERANRRYVDLGPQEASAPAVRPRWLTVAALGRVAAAAAGLIALGTIVLAAMGRDVSLFLAPQPLAFAVMGAVLLARRPGHPMGPLLCRRRRRSADGCAATCTTAWGRRRPCPGPAGTT
jgi:hypothetical protein